MKKKISFVVACYNEELNIPIMYEAISKIIIDIPKYEYEFIFADNASIDNSQRVLRDLAAKDKNVKVILNNRNFGPDRSTVNALLSIKSDAAIVLACDMQDPPVLIPVLLEQWENGAKVVWPQKNNSTESLIMKTLRNTYYKIIKSLSHIKQISHVTGWGLYDKIVIDNFSNIKDPSPILRNLIPALGYDVVLIQYQQPARVYGKSSYNFFSYFDTALSSLVHTSKIPLKVCIFFGLIMSMICVFIGLFYGVYKLLYWDSFQVGLAPLVIGIFMSFAILILFLGILGEYLLSILDRVSFTQYVVEKERINFED